MLLTNEQLAHFDTFGFLILRGLFPKPEIEEIIQDFEEVMSEARGGLPFDGVQRQGITGSFIEKRLSLMRLLEEDRIHRPIEQLLGEDYLYRGSEGNLMVGDTADWHPDGYRPWLHPDGWQLTLAKVQLVFYLDVLTKDTGCLRVVPGSHRPPLYEELKRILAYRPEAHYGLARSNFAGEVDPDSQPFAVEPRDLPCFPLETEPGDVLLWSPNLWHSAFGGRTGRRMFRISFAAKPTTEEQLGYLQAYHKLQVDTRREKDPQCDRVHDESFLASDRPHIRKLAQSLQELNLT